jgi:hypothetical protein
VLPFLRQPATSISRAIADDVNRNRNTADKPQSNHWSVHRTLLPVACNKDLGSSVIA